MFNKILVMGHCQSGRNLIENLLKYNERIIQNHLLWNLEDIRNYIHFITTEIPKNKILLSRCNDPSLLNDIEYFDSSWRFLYIHRNLHDSISSGILTINNSTYMDCTMWATHQEIEQRKFFKKVKNNTLEINFNFFYNNTINVINSVFNFLQLPLPNKSIISYEISKEKTFKFMRENKINTNFEIINLIDNKKIVNDILDFIEHHPCKDDILKESFKKTFTL